MKKIILVLLPLFLVVFNVKAQDIVQYVTNSMTQIALKAQPGINMNQVVNTSDRYPCHIDFYKVDKNVIKIKLFFLGRNENDYNVAKVYGKDSDIGYNGFKMTKYLLMNDNDEYVTMYANLTNVAFVFFSSNGYYKTIYLKK